MTRAERIEEALRRREREEARVKFIAEIDFLREEREHLWRERDEARAQYEIWKKLTKETERDLEVARERIAVLEQESEDNYTQGTGKGLLRAAEISLALPTGSTSIDACQAIRAEAEKRRK